jgi:hypothetical protein
MPLIECPECKKQISDQSPACIHCGHPMQPAQSIQPTTADLDNSNVQRFTGYLSDDDGNVKYVIFYGINIDLAVSGLLERNPGWAVNPKHELKLAPVAPGKYSCPACKAKFTTCKKNIGCVVIIIIFVSLGLGLIMIPFLPHHCECNVCGHKWKS